MKDVKILFITDIHQNIKPLEKLDFNQYDLILCGGDFFEVKTIDLHIVKEIINLLPAKTLFIPGNCDKHSDFSNITSKFTNIHKKTVQFSGLNITGIGYARSLALDMKVYRKYFMEDNSCVFDFIKESPQQFILKFCGIIVNDDKSVSFLEENEALRNYMDYLEKLESFSEEDLESYFNGLPFFDNHIIMTHSPVYGFLDKLPGLPNIGGASLRKAIDKLNPKLVLSGHFHEIPGVVEKDNIIFFNPGSVKDGKAGVIDIINDKITTTIIDI